MSASIFPNRLEKIDVAHDQHDDDDHAELDRADGDRETAREDGQQSDGQKARDEVGHGLRISAVAIQGEVVAGLRSGRQGLREPAPGPHQAGVVAPLRHQLNTDRHAVRALKQRKAQARTSICK